MAGAHAAMGTIVAEMPANELVITTLAGRSVGQSTVVIGHKRTSTVQPTGQVSTRLATMRDCSGLNDRPFVYFQERQE